MSEDPEDLAYQQQYPFVVVHEDKRDGSWTIKSYSTMREALTSPRLPHCTHTVFGSWEDYYEWKTIRTQTKP